MPQNLRTQTRTGWYRGHLISARGGEVGGRAGAERKGGDMNVRDKSEFKN